MTKLQPWTLDTNIAVCVPNSFKDLQKKIHVGTTIDFLHVLQGYNDECSITIKIRSYIYLRWNFNNPGAGCIKKIDNR